MQAIEVTKEMVPYIHYQRTKYYKNNFIFRLLTKLQKISLIFEKLKFLLFANGIIRKFKKGIHAEFSLIEPYLPTDSQNVLDIGSGMAAVDILISKHYGHKIDIHLLDKTMLDTDIYYGFKDKASFYNSFELARKILTRNNVAEENIYTHDAGDLKDVFHNRKYDLVTSFISWGFHYPISTYIKEVSDSMSDNGVLILDVRKDTDGLQEIKRYFKNTTIIHKTPFLDRVYAKK